MANHITRRQWRLTWFDWEEKSSVHGATITEHENRFKVGHWDAFRVMWDAVTNAAGNIMLKCFHFFNWRDSSHWRDSSIHSNCAGRKRANRKIFQRKKKILDHFNNQFTTWLLPFLILSLLFTFYDIQVFWLIENLDLLVCEIGRWLNCDWIEAMIWIAVNWIVGYSKN